MEAPLKLGYESLEPETGPGSASVAETSASAVKHNGSVAPISGGNQDPSTEPDCLPRGPAKENGQATVMSNEIPTQAYSELAKTDSSFHGVADTGGHELDALLGRAFEEKPLWTLLRDNLRDVFFPVKLPPLELTTTPIPVPDRMKVKANPWAIGISTSINGAILIICLLFVGREVIKHVTEAPVVTPIEVGAWQGPRMKVTAGGGGGGGNHSILQASKGKLPPRIKNPVVPPQPQTFDKPKIAAPAAIDVQKNLRLPDNVNMPMIGMKNGPSVVLSQGSGASGGMGSGANGGLGSGGGAGYGPGSGGNAGGGIYRVGGGISAPVAIYAPDPEFSDEARRAKYQGIVIISVIVDAHGNPVNPRVIRPLGMGLDEKALEAIRKYKFKPALKDGKTPVPVMVDIEVDFRLY